MIDCVLGKVERCEFDKQIHPEREVWPALTICFHVAVRVLWEDVKKGYSFKFDARVHLTKSRGLIHVLPHIIYWLLYSLVFFWLNEVPLPSEVKLPIRLKKRDSFWIIEKRVIAEHLLLCSVAWWNLVIRIWALCWQFFSLFCYL